MKFVLRIWRGKYQKIIILGFVLLVGIVAFWFGLVALLRTGFPLLAVNSTSMYPALSYGDLIVVQGVANASEIKAAPAPQGDIVVFHRPGESDGLVISRVVDKTFKNDAWYLRTQLDRNSSPDRWWSMGLQPEDTLEGEFFHEKFLVGRFVGRIPFLGYVPIYVGMFILNPIAMFLIVIAVFLFISLKHPILPRKKTKRLS